MTPRRFFDAARSGSWLDGVELLNALEIYLNRTPDKRRCTSPPARLYGATLSAANEFAANDQAPARLRAIPTLSWSSD